MEGGYVEGDEGRLFVSAGAEVDDDELVVQPLLVQRRYHPHHVRRHRHPVQLQPHLSLSNSVSSNRRPGLEYIKKMKVRIPCFWDKSNVLTGAYKFLCAVDHSSSVREAMHV